jgi:hypothetical protein
MTWVAAHPSRITAVVGLMPNDYMPESFSQSHLDRG